MKSYFSFKTISGTFLANLFIQAITIIQGIVLARFLGPEGRGEFAAIILWPSFFAGIFSFGLYTGIGTIAAKVKNLEILFPSVIISSLVTGFIGSLITFVCIPFLLGENGEELVDITRIFAIFIILNHTARNLLAVEHGAGNFKKFNILRSIVNPIYLALLLILVLFNKASIETFILALLIANVIVVVCIISMIKNLSFEKPAYSLKKVFIKSFSFGVADIAIPVYQYLDKAILLWMLGTISLGYYTVALTASGVISVLAQSIATISFTQIASNKNSVDKIVKVFRLTFVGYLLLGFLLALVLPYLIPMIYGKDFSHAIYPAIILILASFFQGQGYILEQSLRGAGKAFVGLEARLASIIIMLVFGYFFSISLGLIGVVFAFVIAQLLFLVIIANRYIKILKPNITLIPNKKDLLDLFNSISRNLKVGL